MLLCPNHSGETVLVACASLASLFRHVFWHDEMRVRSQLLVGSVSVLLTFHRKCARERFVMNFLFVQSCTAGGEK